MTILATSLPNGSSDPIIWRPPLIEATQVGDFIVFLNRRFDTSLASYDDLHQWSVTNVGPFWSSLLEFSELVYTGSLDPALTSPKLWPKPDWFPNVALNFAENMLRGSDNDLAIIFYSEHQPVQSLSYAELKDEVAYLAQWMRSIGVGSGDVVAGFVPNCPEAVSVTLAAASLGAIWTSCSPDSGTQFALDRFSQTKPKLLVSVDGYVYDNKIFTIEDKVEELRSGLSDLKHTLIISRIPGFSPNDAITEYRTVVDRSEPVPSLEFVRLGFSHPLYILYSSGTTGRPKCLVHSVGGTLLQHVKEHRLQCDLRPGDRLMYYTTTSWMMWNWLISGLASNVTICLFEGKPDPSVVWGFIRESRITAFGTSASWISLCQKTGSSPSPDAVSSVRLLLSTGSALLRDHFDYIHTVVKPNLQIASISGGTDIVSCFVGGGPVPLRRGRLQCSGLGMAVEVWNEKGHRIWGTQGELVCTQPFPCMPVYFLNDSNREKYHSAYFERFDGIWTHGDSAIQYSDGTVEIVGRSDSTIKHHGVRIGTGDIYNVLEGIKSLKDTLVVGRRVGDDEDIVIFVVLKPGVELDAALKRDIRVALIAQSPWFKPDAIFCVKDIPVTANGKKSEILIKNLLNGMPLTNLSVIRNSDCLYEYQTIAKELVAADAMKKTRNARTRGGASSPAH